MATNSAVPAVHAGDILKRATASHKRLAWKFLGYAVGFNALPYLLVCFFLLAKLAEPPFMRWVMEGTVAATVIGLCMTSALQFLKDRPLLIRNSDTAVLCGFIIVLLACVLFLVPSISPIQPQEVARFSYMTLSLVVLVMAIVYTYYAQLIDEVRADPMNGFIESESNEVEKLSDSMKKAREQA
jgi:hypothetical protein